MIYDCFMFFNEVELLDLRLRTLNGIVDYFVIAETNITHTGKPKPYYFDDFKYLFKEYDNKIIHVKAPLTPNLNAWVVENAHRDLISLGIKDAGPEDYIIISDADEIPNPQAVILGINSGFESFGLHQDLYSFYVNCKSSQVWAGSVVIKKKLIKTPNDVRNNRCNQPVNISNGSWHYTSMGGKERIRIKFNAFAETDYNNATVMSDANLDQCLDTGKDIINRTEAWAQKRFITDEEIDHKEVLEWVKEYPNFKK